MSPDLRQILSDAARLPDDLPDVETTWAAARAQRRRRTAVTALLSTGLLAGVVALAVSLPWDDPTPQIVGQVPDESSSDSQSEPSDLAALSSLAVGSTVTTGDGRNIQTRFSDGTLSRTLPTPIEREDRLQGLPDGTLVWQSPLGVSALALSDDAPTTIAPFNNDQPGHRQKLVGTGQVDETPVILVYEGMASSAEDDQGATLWAYRLDGSRTALLEQPTAWEHEIDAVSLRAGWLLYTDVAGTDSRTILRSPDGEETVVDDGSAEAGQGPRMAVLVDYDVAPGAAIVSYVADPALAATAQHRLDVHSLDEPTGAPVTSIAVPAGSGQHTELSVAGEWAYLSLPDASELLQVSLFSGEVQRFAVDGIVALHADLTPRGPDAPPLAACAATEHVSTSDAQAYVWLPCLEDATYAEGDQPAAFYGIHKIRLVTDERASSGGIDQRIEVMLEEIFAGPTTDEVDRGYSGIIDASIDTLAGVTVEGDLVTITLTEAGARAASAGSTARALFQTTINAAVFGGFVDVTRLQVTVEGDCVAWSTYGEGEAACVTWHRDGSVSTG